MCVRTCTAYSWPGHRGVACTLAPPAAATVNAASLLQPRWGGWLVMAGRSEFEFTLCGPGAACVLARPSPPARTPIHHPSPACHAAAAAVQLLHFNTPDACSSRAPPSPPIPLSPHPLTSPPAAHGPCVPAAGARCMSCCSRAARSSGGGRGARASAAPAAQAAAKGRGVLLVTLWCCQALVGAKFVEAEVSKQSSQESAGCLSPPPPSRIQQAGVEG